VGGAGADTITLSTVSGNDTIVLNQTATIDTILNFASADDVIHLSAAAYAGTAAGALASTAFKSGAGATGADALNTDQLFIYNTTTGELHYDAGGSGGAAAVVIANFGAGTSLVLADLFVIA
jgi:serralysin